MNILATSAAMIPSVILCGDSQLSFLKNNNVIDYKFVSSMKLTKKVLDWSDVIVFIRSDSELDAYVSEIAKKANKRLVYVLDDDLLNVPAYINSSPHYNSSKVQNNIVSIMQNCDVFLTPSRKLKEKYSKYFEYAFTIEEPSLQHNITKETTDDVVRVGFAGSIDRAQDIDDIIASALLKVIDHYGNKVSVEFMGAKPDIVEKKQLMHYPYQNSYDEYINVMGKLNWDIGLAPMPISEFHSCKYINKYVEYSSFGIAGIYTKTEPYTSGIKNEVNGLLVDNNTDDWYKAICRLIDDISLRKTIVDNAYNEQQTKYNLHVLAEDYLEKISTGYCGNSTAVRGNPIIYKAISLSKRIVRKIHEQGINTPKWLLNKLLKRN